MLSRMNMVARVIPVTVASLIGAVLLAWPAFSVGTPVFNPYVLGVALAVGLLSSVIPYGLEMQALRRMRPGLFGILMSLEPAAAALAALIVLHELLTLTQWLALVCVVAASVGATRTSPPPMTEPLPD